MAEDGTSDSQSTEGGEETPPGDSTDGQQSEEEKDWKAEAEKWKAHARKHESRAKANEAAAKKVEELENAKKSEAERLADEAKTAAQRAEEAELKALRYEVALEKNVPPKLMKFLSGKDREELETSAGELLEAIGPAKGEENGGSGSGKPKERLRGGASGSDDEPEEMDPQKLAAMIPRGGAGISFNAPPEKE